MNRLELVVREYPERSADYQPVDILIDGDRLIDILKRIEMPYAEREDSPIIAGAYGSLPIKTTFLPSRHFLGEPCPLLQHDDKTAILLCDCGCEGCWDFVCKITVSDWAVAWSDFNQVHR